MQFDKNGWLDEAIEYDYTSKSMPRQGYKITHIVCHGTAGGSSAENIANYFATSSAEASAHIIIGQDGHIAQGIPLKDAAWANGVVTDGHAAWLPDGINPNFYTASIEFVKASTDNSDALTPIQAQVGFEVIACICDTYGIPKRAGDGGGGIISHAAIDPINRARCPGPFDWSGLFAYLAGQPSQPQEEETIVIGLDNPIVAQFFEGNDTAWRCKKNGFTIDHAGLDFYRRFRFGNSDLCGLSWLGLPVGPAIGGIPGKQGVVYQRFERGVLVYDVNRVIDSPPGASGSCYLAHIDQGIGQDPRVTDLQAHIDDLKKQITALQQNALASENATLKAKIAQAVKDLQG